MTTTREQIIETTSDLLERQGYYATGLNEIVQVSGAPKGSLYYYFPEGKEALTAEAIERSANVFTHIIQTELARHADPAAALYHFMLGLAAHVQASACHGGRADCHCGARDRGPQRTADSRVPGRLWTLPKRLCRPADRGGLLARPRGRVGDADRRGH